MQAESELNAESAFRWVRIVSVIQAAAIVLVTWLLAQLGISPILKAVDNLQQDRPIPVIGANEFRYLARTYNKMYEIYKSSVASLNFKASHDELTKVYNRAGYDLLLSSLDLSTASILLIDVDLFKEVNDTYGHEIGDRVLIKIADTLRKYFRTGDSICRIGGDEFVVFMANSGEKHRDLIISKIERINQDLENTEDGLPAISVSVGVVHGSEIEDPAALLELADQRMYQSKTQYYISTGKERRKR